MLGLLAVHYRPAHLVVYKVPLLCVLPWAVFRVRTRLVLQNFDACPAASAAKEGQSAVLRTGVVLVVVVGEKAVAVLLVVRARMVIREREVG